MSFCTNRAWRQSGQATVEAAYLIPVLFIMLLLLIQPGILLYNRIVMQAAASEGCRLLVTKTERAEATEDDYKAYVMRRLGSIPPHDIFHQHRGGCSWEVELYGNESSEYVEVRITNRVKLLPLFDGAGTLLGFADAAGFLKQEVSATMPTQPAWVAASEHGLNPSEWIEKWL